MVTSNNKISFSILLMGFNYERRVILKSGRFANLGSVWYCMSRK